MPNITNKGLKKPLITEPYDLNVINYNTDKINELFESQDTVNENKVDKTDLNNIVRYTDDELGTPISVNADTLGGQLPSYYAKQNDLNVVNQKVENKAERTYKALNVTNLVDLFSKDYATYVTEGTLPVNSPTSGTAWSLIEYIPISIDFAKLIWTNWGADVETRGKTFETVLDINNKAFLYDWQKISTNLDLEHKADKSDALVYEGVFNGSGDLNTANKVNKWYKIDTSAGVLNTPPTSLIPSASWSAIYVQGNGAGSFIQILYSGGYNKVLKRGYFNNAYTEWELFTLQGIALSAGTDLNAIKSEGIFYIFNAINKPSIINGSNLGILRVYKVNSGDWIYQEWTEVSAINNSTKKMYRVINNSTITTWQEIPTIEYGTWTPALLGSGATQGSFTPTEQIGSFIKIGKYVRCYFRLKGVLSNATISNSAVFLAYLPITPKQNTVAGYITYSTIANASAEWKGFYASLNTITPMLIKNINNLVPVSDILDKETILVGVVEYEVA